MSIASAITAAQGRVADCYTAISGKGGTLPATQNLANMPTAINSIPSGGGGSTKYGASIDAVLGDVDANGVLQTPTEQSDLVFTGVEDVGAYALHYRFTRTNVKSISFPDLTTVSGTYGLGQTFLSCDSLTSISMPDLTTVSGTYGCYYMFSACPFITSVSMPNLTTISGSNGCRYMFYTCPSLTSVSLPSLTTVSGDYGCGYMFQGCPISSITFQSLNTVSGANACTRMFNFCQNISDIYFPALTTTSFGSNVNQFNNMFDSNSGSTSGAITMHFPSNLSSTIAGLTGYPNFGATAGRLTLAFDLPATS